MDIINGYYTGTYTGPVFPDGNGVMTYTNGSVYTGEFKNGKPFGKGTTKTQDSTNDNEIKNGLIMSMRSILRQATDRKGYSLTTTLALRDGSYTGNVIPHGKGKLTYISSRDDTSVFEGVFKNGKMYEGTDTRNGGNWESTTGKRIINGGKHIYKNGEIASIATAQLKAEELESIIQNKANTY